MGFKSWYGRISLANKILIAMVLGALIGYIVGPGITVLDPIGTIFLRLLKMVILPLVFFSIAAGASSVIDLSRLKRIGGLFLVYWVLSSLAAAAVGLVWAAIFKPGVGVKLAEKAAENAGEVNLLQSFINWIPDNVAAAFTNFNMIQVIVFSIFCGLTAAALGETDSGRFLRNFFKSGDELMMKMVGYIMEFAPYGVFALMANITGTAGTIVLGALAKMLVTQYVAYATILFVVYPMILTVFARVNPIQHFRNIFPAMVVAFSTCSSSATLPVTMESTKKRAGVPEDIVNLIAPPAATINMHAVAAEMPIYALFAAQIFGLDLAPASLLSIIVLGVVMAAGVAGVPGGAVMMASVLMNIMGLPMTIIPWIAGIYRLIDMPNTMLNVTGDTVGMVTVASMMGELDRETFQGNN
ncbi:dicarboxylate/amino acid:cation symporter [Thermosediminibacter litoriperuensis]|uniref:Na+/H+-dicarboxylate symporter n=1 Tax=Thermosediminibacter litoriperuensis TaxID=291989 RepID=A0A5S5AIH6_9FIRM|nr:dicarboxylate/amino acid:cation symporter [Thermosediminibacter litoriperuensis]TYP49241.1 Na+/H+-dicarboxylate symporter [Thermosediminibacter litoriperuensis]